MSILHASKARLAWVAAISVTGVACSTVFGLDELHTVQPAAEGGTAGADASDADASARADADASVPDTSLSSPDAADGRHVGAVVPDAVTGDVSTLDVV